ncbi:lysophospholipid acyltransferase family protein [Geomesophilobacter sediminis]|uniref:1-acyl-sn-glycerol-3-phosphate acyltransferase n=1 Tax=Geomesophilobacter sediminis TaxID=2798584 RepID=A0A8J7JMC4_9BACT|nr:lysophospholipid acyltransferase family protein [Geomesophilobacter sediminis]MBJ6725705.1 1-acyl-sn-glycerol-3-phosphate acyltransferase [Geomesophilobacter sediminis]
MWLGRFYLIFLIPYTLFCSIGAVLAGLVDRSGKWSHAWARLWSYGCVKAAGVRLVVDGTDKIPTDGPVIYMGNHQGNFDIHVLSIAIPRRFSWIAKAELFRVPVFGGAMRRAGYVPLDRSDGRKALKSMKEAAARIASGTSVVIFPEGTRSTDGNLLPFKRGAFLLAAKAGVPIVPFTINGSRRANPAHTLELNPGTIHVTFSDPIPVAGEKEDVLLERVREAVTARLEAP